MKKKILYLVGTDPRNTNYGGEQRTHFIWEALKRVGDVYTVIPVAHKYLERVDEKDRIHWICLERRYTPGWLLQRFLSRWSLFYRIGVPLGINRRKIKQLKGYHACVVRYTNMASSFEAWKIAPLFMDVDDLTSEIMKTRFLNSPSCWHHVYISCVECYEKWVFRKCNQLWVSNPLHVPLLKEFNTFFIPNIVKTTMKPFHHHVSDKPIILFVGSLGSAPNFEGLDFFVEMYWEEVLSVYPDLNLKIIGGGLSSIYYNKWKSYRNIQLLGYVDNLEPFYKECMCTLAPIYYGSGSCIKVIESLTVGRIVLGTPFATRGLNHEYVNRSNGIHVFHDLKTLLEEIGFLKEPHNRKTEQEATWDFVNRLFSFEKLILPVFANDTDKS